MHSAVESTVYIDKRLEVLIRRVCVATSYENEQLRHKSSDSHADLCHWSMSAGMDVGGRERWPTRTNDCGGRAVGKIAAKYEANGELMGKTAAKLNTNEQLLGKITAKFRTNIQFLGKEDCE